MLLFVVTHLDLSGAKAYEHWLCLLRQWDELNRRVPGKVDLWVAVLQSSAAGGSSGTRP